MTETGSAPRSDWRAMISLYAAMMAVGMGQSVVFAVLPMLGRELALHEMLWQLPFTELTIAPKEMAITSLSALTALVFFMTSPYWGRKSDVWGRKPIIIIGLFGYTIGTMLFNAVAWMGLVSILGGGLLYVLLMVSRGIHAALMSATHPASAAYMVDVTDISRRAQGMAKLQAFNQLGVMLGPALAWFVAFSYLTPLYLQAALAALVAILVWRYLPAIPAHSSGGKRPKRMAYFDPRYRLFIFIGFALYSLLGMVQQTLGFYFQDLLSLDGVAAAQWFSAAMIVSSGAMLFAQFVVVQRYNGSPMNLLFMGLPFSCAGYLLLALSDTLPMLLSAMGLFGFGMGLTGPAYGASASLVVEPHEQGGLAGLLGSVAGLGFVAGPLVGGFLYRIAPSYPYFCAAAVMALIIVVMVSRRRQIAKG
ncbi:MFS transporter [Spongiibacter sp. UBA1325]|uniref:MFS transporter n=1 Tax=Spongiibacter sp. UBA1325 TaxID=1947543 RepID=UPI00257A3232|nr:MFS transporter [Spongiibacter sp. UBA1325]